MNALLPSEIWPDAPVRNERPSSTMDIAAPMARLKFVVAEKKNVDTSAQSMATALRTTRTSVGWFARIPRALKVAVPAMAMTSATLSATPSRIVAAPTRLTATASTIQPDVTT